MPITIAERFRPFSHEPGTPFILPHSWLRVRAYPTKIIVDDLSTNVPKRISEIDLSIEGPVKDFTIQQDLEKNRIVIWGDSKQGYFRYHLFATEEHAFHFFVEKAPIGFTDNFQPIKTQPTTFSLSQTRLSLGVQKQQDWTLMRRRLDMAEILPIWFKLGSSVPTSHSSIFPEKGRDEALPFLESLFLAYFEGGLSPRAYDNDFQGIPINIGLAEKSAIALLSEGATFIQKLFVNEVDETTHVLTKTPVPFHCGRFLQVPIKLGLLDLEWTKKWVRRLVLTARETGIFKPVFHQDIVRFRFRKDQDKSEILQCPTEIYIEEGCKYYFDRFE